MEKFYKFFIIILMLFISVSCAEKQKLEWFDLNLEFPGQVEEFNNGNIPGYLEPFVSYLEFDKCKNVMYVPKITVKRMDIGVSKKLEVPLSGQAKFQMKMKMLAAQHIKDGYKVENLKLPDFLNKPKSEFDENNLKTLNPSRKYVITLSENANKEQIEKAKNTLEEYLCKEGAKTITIHIVQALSSTAQSESTQEEDQSVQAADKTQEPENTTTATQTTKTTTTTTVVRKTPARTRSITVGNTRFAQKDGNYYSSFARYEGGVENGKAHGQGTMIFTRSHLIPVPPYSAKKITARKGYKLAGRFNNGYFVSGKLYDAGGHKIKSIYIGR